MIHISTLSPPPSPHNPTLSCGSIIVTATCQSHHLTWKESLNSAVLLGQSHFSPFENYSCLCAFYLLISKVLSLKASTLCVDSAFSCVYLSVKGLSSDDYLMGIEVAERYMSTGTLIGEEVRWDVINWVCNANEGISLTCWSLSSLHLECLWPCRSAVLNMWTSECTCFINCLRLTLTVRKDVIYFTGLLTSVLNCKSPGYGHSF